MNERLTESPTNVGSFRIFATNQFYDNLSEYQDYGQKSPYTLETYVQKNLQDLKARYRKKYFVR